MRDFYSFVVAATNPISGVGETAVLISLPQKICEGMQITDQIISTTIASTSIEVETTGNPNTITTVIDSETIENTTVSFTTSISSETCETTTKSTTSVVSQTTEHTTLIDTETTEKNWNETTLETTKGYCS